MEDFNLDCFDLDDSQKVKTFIEGLRWGIKHVIKRDLDSKEFRALVTQCLLPPKNDNFTIWELAAMKHILKNNLI